MKRIIVAAGLAIGLMAALQVQAQTISLAPDKPQTPTSVNLVYLNMKPATQVRYVNATSGAKLPPYTLRIEGSGTLSLPKTPPITQAGSYYVLAELNGVEQARTVTFTTEPAPTTCTCPPEPSL